MPSPKETYSDRVVKLQKEAGKVSDTMAKISLFRLAAGLSTGLTFYLGVNGSSYFFILTGVLLVAFFYLVNHHARLKEKHAELNLLLGLNVNELKNLSGENDTFDYHPGGNQSGHIYANDLDIFGSLSLFRQINRTTTITGKELVVGNLLQPVNDIHSIRERQEILNDLYSAVEWRQRFYAIGAQSTEKPTDIPRLSTWNGQPRFFSQRKLWIVAAAVLSLATLVAVLSMILLSIEYFSYVILVLVLNSIVYQIFFRAKANSYFSRFGDFSVLFSRWSELSTLITEKPFRSGLGNKLKAQVAGAPHSFREISNLNKLIAFRANKFMLSLTNGFCLFDVWFMLQIETWRKKNGKFLDQWIDGINQVDFLNSFANYKFNHPQFCNAEVSDGPLRISATLLGHPLIQGDRLVANDFAIGIPAKAHIITGSNMSGKSTFLRAVGLNTILALNGLPVCARTFSCSPLLIATSIRINDSLEENQSYFRAEIGKLSHIVKLLESKQPYLVLLDEILRGTNSTDKQTGTRLFYQRLAGFNCLALLATHDPEIGNLANESPLLFQNFHFESYLEGSELRFDYLLRPGVSVTKNATLLMRQLNLI